MLFFFYSNKKRLATSQSTITIYFEYLIIIKLNNIEVFSFLVQLLLLLQRSDDDV